MFEGNFEKQKLEFGKPIEFPRLVFGVVAKAAPWPTLKSAVLRIYLKEIS